MEVNVATSIRDTRASFGLFQLDLAAKADVGVATLWRLDKEEEETLMS